VCVPLGCDYGEAFTVRRAPRLVNFEYPHSTPSQAVRTYGRERERCALATGLLRTPKMSQNNTMNVSRKRGRPRGGVRPGERLRDYPVLTVRVPPDTRAMFTELCTRRRMPRWMMLRHLIVCFVRNLPANERRRIVQRSKVGD
jgi:hypothetical protein